MRSSITSVLLFLASVAVAQQPYLVKDLRTSGPISGSSFPQQFVSVGDTLYFLATNREAFSLWRSDGTAAGTTLVAPMPATRLTPLGSRVIGTSPRLWISDGTAAGTSIVAGIDPADSPPIELNGKLYFSAARAKLYATDGTASGTAVVADTQGNNEARLLARIGDRIAYFNDAGLGVTDGTAAGTFIINKAATSIDAFAVTPSRFFFRSSSDLWVSDGTAAGTQRLKSFIDSRVAAIDDRVVFFTQGDPWVSDGTSTGTFALAHLAYTLPIARTTNIAVLNGIAYFPGEDGSGGLAIWRSDGTIGGTRVAVLQGNRAAINDISAAAGKLWVSLGESPSRSLWISDGSVPGTRAVSEVNALNTPRTSFNGRAVFAGDDNVHGFEPWLSDGTTLGTAMLADLFPNVAPTSNPFIRAAAGNRVIFDASDDGNAPHRWVSDGTADGTQPFPQSIASGSIRYHGLLYFGGEKSSAWSTDGTVSGTRLILPSINDTVFFAIGGDILYVLHGNTIYAVDGSSDPAAIGHGRTSSSKVDAMGDLVYRSDISGDDFLYAISGTNAPRLLTSFTQTLYSPFLIAGGFLCYFAPADGATELWRTDGTAGSLTLIQRFAPYQLPVILGNAGDRLVFAIDDGIHGREPWVTDGTENGTSLLADIVPGPASTTFKAGVSVGDRVVFGADDGNFGLEPWVSDGTAAGTHLIADIAPGRDSSIQTQSAWIAMKGNAFFVATDTDHGTELWRTDGTAGGTQLAGDIEPGPRSSYPNQLIAADDTLYFTAETIANGRELWALPVPGRTIAIGDGHASESASSGQMLITLDRPSSQGITAWWTAYGEPHRVAFSPGETRKTISISIAPDGGTRTIPVHLDNVAGATPIRPAANLVVQPDPGPADLAVAVRTVFRNGENVPYVIVTNRGPSAVPSVNLTLGGSANAPSSRLLGSLRSGESTPYRFGDIGLFTATVSGPRPDPDSSNNTATFRTDSDYLRTLAVSISPAALTTGMHATLSISSRNDGVVTLTSSNPLVLPVPESVKAPAELDLVALAEGTTIITATNAYGRTQGMTLSVGPPGAFRWPSELQFTIVDAALYYGTPRAFSAHVSGASADNTRPGGTVTFFDGAQGLATIPLDAAGNAKTTIKTLLPGDHSISARYSGDANFLPAGGAPILLHIHAPAPVTFAGSARPVSKTEDEVTIVVVVQAGSPGGTITLTDLGKNVLATDIPIIAGRAVTTIPRMPSVTVHYSGDDLFAPAVVNVTLAPSHRHAAGR